ncbi:MAG: hypothetical protein D8M59_10855 [Planctomycetes bacterium]|nr:hypothetical protein [Planctomycetota bacterium]NOG54151.1 hypothetical protein [Planctomycetota bacterium]
MKTLQGLAIVALALSVLFVTACEYDAPLTKKHTIAIDEAVLGLWQAVPEDEAAADEEAMSVGDGEMLEEPAPPSLLVLKFSDTEYVVVYAEDDESMYFRAYPIKIGDTECVQMQAIGTEEGSVDDDDSNRFMVMKYEISAAGHLSVRMLDSDVVDSMLTDSDSLKAAFLEHEHDENLFSDEALVFPRAK